MEMFLSTLLGVLLNLVKIALLITLATVTIFSPPLLGAFYPMLAFYPFQENLIPVAIGPYKCETLTFPGPRNTSLCAWYYKNPGATRVIMVSHGNAGNMSHRAKLAEHLLNAGCSVFMYDYGGYGNSTGSPSPDAVCQDGLVAYDYLCNKLAYAPQQIVIYGESIGGAVASYITAHREPAALIIQSGFLSLPDIAKEKFAPFKLFPNALFYQPHMSNLDALQQQHPPLLIMHGVQDRVIPFRHGEQLAAAASKPVTFVPLTRSGHNDTYIADAQLFDQSLKEFLNSLAPSN